MRIINKCMLLIVGGLLGITSVGCSSTSKEKSEEKKIQVSVSIVPQKTFVEKVCGDLAEVNVMIPPGNSPANYEPTPKEIEDFSKSEIYFSIGVPTETANILPAVNSETETVELAKLVNEVYPDRKMGENRDPHIWLSPKRAMVMVQEISDTMCELDKDNSKTYTENAEKYINELKKLDKDLKDATSNMETKKFIVFHPAFGYLADDYGLEMYSLEQNGKEATADHLMEMIDLAKEEKIETIFYQAEIDSSQSESFAEEIGGETAMLAPLSPDYIDNMEIMIETISKGSDNE